MTSNPFDSGELGRNDPDLDRIGEQLERYAADSGGQPPLDLAVRIREAVDREPLPGRGVMHWLRLHSGPLTAVAATAAAVALVAGAVAIGQLAERTRDQVGTSPSPTVLPTSTPTPSSSPTPTPTPSPSESPTPTVSPSETASPSPTDDDGGVETPEPSEPDGSGGSDNSGPGGGGSGGGGSSGSGGPGSGGDGP